MIPLAIQSVTALHFLFGLPRFSEDLDFALERPERGGFDIPRLADRVAAQLVRDRLAAIDWRAVERDVAPFLKPGPAGRLF